MPNAEDHFRAALNSPILRLSMVGVLGLLQLIPIVMIGSLVSERRERRDSAVAEVSAKWGNSQSVTGPVLVIPYTARWTTLEEGGREIPHAETRTAVFLPKQLRATGRVDVESRQRGIFEIPVYQLRLALEGEFAKPDFAGLDIEANSIDWQRAHLAVGISDVRAIREQATLQWNGKSVDFLPGLAGFADGEAGIHAPVGISATDSDFRFSIPLALNGSGGVYLVPAAEQTTFHLTSNAPDPNFQGSWLPSERTVTSDGFDSTWKVSYLGRNYPQAWISRGNFNKAIEASRFGVELAPALDHYRMADRSVKYAVLFIFLTFATVWLVEVLSGARVHPIQYLLMGGAMCVFYLLELSLSEHLSFPWAYGIASLAVVAMVASYSKSIFRTARRAAGVPASIVALYSYLYVLLTNEDGALLVGSVGLFVTLALIMFLTRRVHWYGEEVQSATQ